MSFSMKTNYTHSPKDIEHYSTDELRDQFLNGKTYLHQEIFF
jgi:hypothetical protein